MVQALAQILNKCSQRLFSSYIAEVAIYLFGHNGVVLHTCYSLPTAPKLAALNVGDLTVDKSRFHVIV
jgi:hypothetical protein